MSRGGRREGAGRPAGSAWKPAVRALRVETIQKMADIVGSDRDPLTVVVGWVLDETLDLQLRMSAAHVCLPYLYPKLSQTTVDSRHTVLKVESADLVQRLSDRIARLAPAEAVTVEAEATPVENDADLTSKCSAT